jgi:hypothetical protein
MQELDFDHLRVLWYVGTHNLVHGRGPEIREIALWLGSTHVRPRLDFLKKKKLLTEKVDDKRSFRPTLKGYERAGFFMCGTCGQPSPVRLWPVPDREAYLLEGLRRTVEKTGAN